MFLVFHKFIELFIGDIHRDSVISSGNSLHIPLNNLHLLSLRKKEDNSDKKHNRDNINTRHPQPNNPLRDQISLILLTIYLRKDHC